MSGRAKSPEPGAAPALITAGPDHIDIVRELFVEYAQSLGFSLCFQGFDAELAGLPGEYAPPRGCLLLATAESDTAPLPDADAVSASTIAGCVALRPIAGDICEMKRLYVRPAFRGRGIGRLLATAVIAAARDLGYRRMRLDTIEARMQEAVALYRSLGFRPITQYTVNPIAGALFMELEL